MMTCHPCEKNSPNPLISMATLYLLEFDTGNENLRKNLLRAATPYVVSWDDVAVQVLHTTISSYSIPKVFNMSLNITKMVCDLNPVQPFL